MGATEVIKSDSGDFIEDGTERQNSDEALQETRKIC